MYHMYHKNIKSFVESEKIKILYKSLEILWYTWYNKKNAHFMRVSAKNRVPFVYHEIPGFKKSVDYSTYFVYQKNQNAKNRFKKMQVPFAFKIFIHSGKQST